MSRMAPWRIVESPGLENRIFICSGNAVALGVLPPSKSKDEVTDALCSGGQQASALEFVPLRFDPLAQSTGEVDLAALQRLVDGRRQVREAWGPQAESLGGHLLPILSAPILPVLHVADFAVPRVPLGAGDAAMRPVTRKAPAAAGVGPIAAYQDGGCLKVPAGAPPTLTAALYQAARTFPDRGVTCITATGESELIRYSTLVGRAARFCKGLQALASLGKGDSAILQLESHSEHLAAFWACLLGGVRPVAVAVPPSYEDPHHAVVRKLINIWHLLGQPVLLAAAGSSVAAVRRHDGLGNLRVLTTAELEGFPAQGSFQPCLSPIEPSDVAFYQLSSGSTGVPKCVQISHAGVVAHVQAEGAVCNLTEADRTLNWLAMDHVVPILTCHCASVYFGCNEVQVHRDYILADPSRWLELLAMHKVTRTWAPNFAYKLVADAVRAAGKDFDLSHVRYFMNAGEQVTMPAIRDFLAAVEPFGVRESSMQPAFGMAETCTCMTYCNQFSMTNGHLLVDKRSLGQIGERLTVAGPGTPATAVGAFVNLGPPVPGVEIRIADERGRRLCEDEVGLLHVRGAVVTAGYVGNEAANAEVLAGDGWLNSGDLGFMHHGHLYLTSRAKETIVVRGSNVHCHELEDLVGDVLGVKRTFAAAVPARDGASGTEVPAVFYVPADTGLAWDGTNDVALFAPVPLIRAQVLQRMGVSLGPVLPIPEQEFPKTTGGKIQRSALQRRLEDGQFTDMARRADLILRDCPDRLLEAWFHRPTWRRKRVEAEVHAKATRASTIVLCNNIEIAREIQQALATSEASTAVHIAPTIDCAQPYGGPKLRGFIEASQAAAMVQLVHVFDYSALGRAGNGAIARACWGLLELQHALVPYPGREHERKVRLLDVALLPERDPPAQAATRIVHASVGAVLKTLAVESPWLEGCQSLQVPASLAAPDVARVIAQELAAAPTESDIRYEGADCRRLVWRLEEAAFDFVSCPTAAARVVLPSATGKTVITGGLGGVGTELALWFLRDVGAPLVILGRRAEEDVHVQARLKKLRAVGDVAGASVEYMQADLTNHAQLSTALARAGGVAALRAVVHLAGTYATKAADAYASEEEFEADIRGKVEGTQQLVRVLHEQRRSATGRDPLPVLVLSSVNGMFGGRGAAAYAAASACVDALMAEETAKPAGSANAVGRALEWHCLSFTSWEGVGMSAGRADASALARAQGFHALAPQQGVRSFAALLRGASPGHWLVGLDATHPRILKLMQNLRYLPAERFVVALPERPGSGVLDDGPFLRASLEVRRLPVADFRRGGAAAVRQVLEGRRNVEIATPAERQLAHSLADKLCMAPRVVLEAPSFVELGIDSMRAAVLIALVNEQFGSRLQPHELFRFAGVHQLAAHFEGGAGSGDVAPARTSSRCVHVLRAGDQRLPPLFAMMTWTGTVACYHKLARQLDVRQPILGIADPYVSGVEPNLATDNGLWINTLADAVVAEWPCGPYYLLGFSQGGMIALLVAEELRGRGCQVADLILVEAVPLWDGFDWIASYMAEGMQRAHPLTLAWLPKAVLCWVFSGVMRSGSQGSASWEVDAERAAALQFAIQKKANDADFVAVMCALTEHDANVRGKLETSSSKAPTTLTEYLVAVRCAFPDADTLYFRRAFHFAAAFFARMGVLPAPRLGAALHAGRALVVELDRPGVSLASRWRGLLHEGSGFAVEATRVKAGPLPAACALNTLPCVWYGAWREHFWSMSDPTFLTTLATQLTARLHLNM